MGQTIQGIGSFCGLVLRGLIASFRKGILGLSFVFIILLILVLIDWSMNDSDTFIQELGKITGYFID